MMDFFYFGGALWKELLYESSRTTIQNQEPYSSSQVSVKNMFYKSF